MPGSSGPIDRRAPCYSSADHPRCPTRPRGSSRRSTRCGRRCRADARGIKRYGVLPADPDLAGAVGSASSSRRATSALPAPSSRSRFRPGPGRGRACASAITDAAEDARGVGMRLGAAPPARRREAGVLRSPPRCCANAGASALLRPARAAGSATDAGCIGNRSEGCTGLSNVFAASARPRDLRCGRGPGGVRSPRGEPVVGYHRGAPLEAVRRVGFREVGRLRVWVYARRDCAPARHIRRLVSGSLPNHAGKPRQGSVSRQWLSALAGNSCTTSPIAVDNAGDPPRFRALWEGCAPSATALNWRSRLGPHAPVLWNFAATEPRRFRARHFWHSRAMGVRGAATTKR